MTTTETIPTKPTLPTREMVEQFRAFGPIDLNPALCVETVHSRGGNVILPAGTVTWVNGHIYDDEFVSVWTADTHYAGVKTSTILATNLVPLDGTRMYCGWSYTAESPSGEMVERFNRSFTELVLENDALIRAGWTVAVTDQATGLPVHSHDIVRADMLIGA